MEKTKKQLQEDVKSLTTELLKITKNHSSVSSELRDWQRDYSKCKGDLVAKSIACERLEKHEKGLDSIIECLEVKLSDSEINYQMLEDKHKSFVEMSDSQALKVRAAVDILQASMY